MHSSNIFVSIHVGSIVCIATWFEFGHGITLVMCRGCASASVPGHNCFGAVLYPITMADFTIADVTDAMLDGPHRSFSISVLW